MKKALVGTKVKHGSPGYEQGEVIEDVTFNSSNRVVVHFESGFMTNMTQEECDKFAQDGSIEYTQHFGSAKDTGLAVMYSLAFQ